MENLKTITTDEFIEKYDKDLTKVIERNEEKLLKIKNIRNKRGLNIIIEWENRLLTFLSLYSTVYYIKRRWFYGIFNKTYRRRKKISK